MYLAETASTALAKFDPMDIMMLLFTIVIFIGLVRLVMSPKKNKFAIGWAAVSFLVFAFANYVMIFKVWMS